MAITYTKDIPDFNIKVKQVTDIDSLETTVSQLSASLVTVKGDVTEAQGDITTLAGAMTAANEEIDDIWKCNNILGAKNLLPYPYFNSTVNVNGLTLTANTNGTITVSGTTEAESSAVNIFYFDNSTTDSMWYLPEGSYILSAPTQEYADYTIYSWVRIYYNDGTSPTYTAKSSNVEFVVRSGAVNIRGGYAYETVTSGMNINTTLYPMLRPADYQDSTYAPYAMTNKELTNIVQCNQTTNGTYTLKATVSSDGVTYAWTADS